MEVERKDERGWENRLNLKKNRGGLGRSKVRFWIKRLREGGGKMKTFNSLLFTLLFLSFGAVTLLVSASFAEVGVTENSIKIGGALDITATDAFSVVPGRKGIETYFQKINAEGGIYGRKLQYVIEDDAYVVSKSLANFKKLVKTDKVFCMLYNDGIDKVSAQMPLIEEEKIPLVSPIAIDDAVRYPPKRYIFPGYIFMGQDQGRQMVWYIYNTLGIKKPKLGIIWMEGKYCQGGMEAARDYARKLGIEPLAIEMFPRGAIDVSSQVLKMKMAGVEHILMMALEKACASSIKELKRLDWRPSIYFQSSGGDTNVVRLVGEDGLWPERVVAMAIVPLPEDTDFPGIREVHALIKKYDPQYVIHSHFSWGIVAAKILEEGLKRAGKDLTREGLVNAFETFRNFETGLSSPLTYTPTIRGGEGKGFIYQMKRERGEIRWVMIDKWVTYPR
jgi:branched-chain amino acid transport system substrate-binding protein